MGAILFVVLTVRYGFIEVPDLRYPGQKDGSARYAHDLVFLKVL